MAENKKKSSDSSENAAAKKVAKQETTVAKITEAFGKNPSDELEIELNRERDTLRHLRLVQKGNPLERAETKHLYAAKAAMSRAIQPVEE